MNIDSQRLESVGKRIRLAAEMAGRDPSSVRLLAVSKNQPAERVRSFFELGQPAFGENRAREALQKQCLLEDFDIEWHFIGPVQSNKTRELAENFQWVQSVDRLKVLRRLSAQRPPSLPPLNICLQVNIDLEAQKSGLHPNDVHGLARQAADAPRIVLRGLMAIPRLSADEAATRGAFARLRELYHELRSDGHALDTLSMGMSGDLELAVREGSTMVRVGTDLFGPRQS